MSEISHYYWDTCIFVAYLNKMEEAYGVYVEHIGQFLEEARKGECKIYTSGITIAEVPRKRMLASKYGDFNEFLADYAGAITPIGADPNVMATAAEIKNLAYAKTGGRREVGTLDAVHLASALALIDVYEVPLTAFHTFDDGNSKGLEGKAVPLLSFETWCEECIGDPVAQRVIGSARKRPDHPFPKLPISLPIASKPGDVVPLPPSINPLPSPGTSLLATGLPSIVDMSLLESLLARSVMEAPASVMPLTLPAPPSQTHAPSPGNGGDAAPKQDVPAAGGAVDPKPII